MKDKRYIKHTESMVWQEVPVDLVSIAKSINSPVIALQLIKQIDWEQGHPEFTKSCLEYFKEEVKKFEDNL